ncbi:DUF2497 domain-containing protein [Kaistia dalseonensis]|uniref:Cell pole-organizing protein PopZ n=1 Tax=Kaistia dalseonensis TaxID=410840 RepID=A0ABU0H268_9HYPH|nr:DUF2497 domain-containing protein [Kaistia dalseonensis]MCX5493837.1 DUF2497 domain-containing protein [Kaistia dalseonensis]MDQ0436402.1 cell pole-organizing protein PopZ [Kaistia dalseonensis]
MEEILASIRRIIADDDAQATPQPVLQTPNHGPIGISTDDIDALFGARTAGPPRQAKPEPARLDPARAEPVRRESVAPKLDPAPVRPAPLATEPAQPQFRRAEPGEHKAELNGPVRPAAPPVRAPSPGIDQGRPAMHAEAPVASHAPLMSPAADAAVHAAFGSLSGAVGSSQSRTIEDLVKEVLRPMLKNWLDTNLPPLVERLVRDEIERVSRGR